MLLVSARLRVEAGMPHSVKFLAPLHLRLWVEVVGGNNCNPNTMTGLGFLSTYSANSSAHIADFLEGFKMADEVGMERKRLIPAFIIGMVAALIIAPLIILPYIYDRGANNSPDLFAFTAFHGRYTFDGGLWAAVLGSPEGVNFYAVGVMAMAFMGPFLLSWLTNIFLWWPFHPAGLVIAYCQGGLIFGGNFLFVWIIKFFVTRYGGVKLYQRLTPFFLALILSNIAMGLLGGFIGIAVSLLR
jgi:hypothetical protein